MKTAVACVYKTGGDFDAHHREYITRLRLAIPNTHRLFCLTNEDVRVFGVETIPLEHLLKGWRSKYELFRPGLWDGFDRVLYFDLDTVVTGDISDLLSGEKDTSDFMLLRDFYHPGRLNTGVMAWRPRQQHSMILDKGLITPGPDADVIVPMVTNPGVLQDVYSITSYKADAKQGAVTCFHGSPRPHEVGWRVDKKLEVVAPPPLPLVRNDSVPGTPFLGQPVYVIGGGPSLANFNMATLNGKHCMAVNDAYWYPQCHTMFFGDGIWFDDHEPLLARWAKAGNDVWTCAAHSRPWMKHIQTCGTMLPPPARRKAVCWYGNSGISAIHMAMLLGAAEIYLVGFDMQLRDGASNWHPNRMRNTENTYVKFMAQFEQFDNDYCALWKKQCPIYNATPNSALTCFEHKEIGGWA